MMRGLLSDATRKRNEREVSSSFFYPSPFPTSSLLPGHLEVDREANGNPLGPLDLTILLDLLDLPRQPFPLRPPPVQRPSSTDESLESSFPISRSVSSSSSGGSSSRRNGGVDVDVEFGSHRRDGFGLGSFGLNVAFGNGEVDL